MSEKPLSVWAMELAMEAEKDPHRIVERAEEIEKFLIKSGDEIHYAYSTDELLRELVRREEGNPVPTKRHWHSPATEYVFAIGPDHTASLVILDEGLEVLLDEESDG